MSNNNRKFLDYNGLETFWNNINSTFAKQSDAIKSIDFRSNDAGESIMCTIEKVDANSNVVLFPMANADSAGAITSEMFTTISMLQGGDVTAGSIVPIKGLKLGSKETSLNDRFSDISLEYKPSDDGTRHYLSIIDSRFLNNACWKFITEEEWNRVTDNNTLSPGADYCEYDNTYYHWYSGDKGEQTTPAYIGNVPVLNVPKSEIDATEFVKSGFLKSAGYDVIGKKPYIVLTFSTYDPISGEDEKSIHINVSDLIDEYVAGEGISIDNYEDDLQDEEKHLSAIYLKPATVDELGGIKVSRSYYNELNENGEIIKYGFSVNANQSNIIGDIADDLHYCGVEADCNKKAFVYVPWRSVSVETESNIDGSYGLMLEHGDSEDSLTDTIYLGKHTRAALANADSAMQTIKIADIELIKDNHIIEKADLQTALDLKSAAYSDVSDAVKSETDNTDENDNKLPTCKAVETHVEDSINTTLASLKGTFPAGSKTIPNESFPEDDVYRSRPVNYFYKTIEIVNGLPVTKQNDNNFISIYDIADFCPLSTKEINKICGIQSNQ
jgi:hypothetical protein